MRILIFNFEYPPLGGGGVVATKQMAEELATRHEVHVITSAYRGLLPQEVTRRVVIHRAPVFGRRERETATLLSLLTFVPSTLFVGWKVLRSGNWDVINAQFVVPSGVPAALLARIFRVPLVVSFIGGDLYDPSKGTSPHRSGVIRWLVCAISRRAAARTAISSDTKRRAEELHGVTQTIEVTHLGLVPQTVSSATREELGLPKEGTVVVSVGRLIPRKGYSTLLKAVSSTDMHVAIVGDGPLRESLAQEAKELGVADRVHFMGFLSEERKLQVLNTADVYASAAEHEGFGIVLLEAMQAALPIVAYEEGGHTDFLAHGENALLVPLGNTDQFTSELSRLASDEGMRARMGEANQNKVKEFYLEKTAAQFESILTNAAGHHDQSRSRSGPNHT